MEEAEQLCGRVAIIDYGKIVALDSPAALKSRVAEMLLRSNKESLISKVSRNLIM